MKQQVITVNPYNLEEIADYDFYGDGYIGEIIEGAHDCFKNWKKTRFEEREDLVNRISKTLEKNKNEYAKLITTEMGKPIRESIAEIEKCIWLCEYYKEHAKDHLADEKIETDATKSYITYQPTGVIFAVMPWNFPFWQVFRFAIPNIIAGNTAVLKHAENTTGCSLEIENIFKEAEAPKGLFNSIVIQVEQVENIISNPKITGVTLTGSKGAGSSVASLSGKYVKKSVLELGGSDPYIILKDADIEQATDICVKSRMINGGQTCISAKRFIIEEDIYDDFLELFKKKMGSIEFGNPMDKKTKLGPLASIKHRDDLHDLVGKSVSQGAKCILGGEIPDEKGAFYTPTILSDFDEDNIAYQEEFFGPVSLMTKAKNERQAIELANKTPFGLGGAIFSRNIQRAEYIAKNELESGAVFINDFVKSDPRLPFGGIKESGYGRELSEHGIKEFINIKILYLK